jgi:hypothetical protein
VQFKFSHSGHYFAYKIRRSFYEIWGFQGDENWKSRSSGLWHHVGTSWKFKVAEELAASFYRVKWMGLQSGQKYRTASASGHRHWSGSTMKGRVPPGSAGSEEVGDLIRATTRSTRGGSGPARPLGIEGEDNLIRVNRRDRYVVLKAITKRWTQTTKGHLFQYWFPMNIRTVTNRDSVKITSEVELFVTMQRTDGLDWQNNVKTQLPTRILTRTTGTYEYSALKSSFLLLSKLITVITKLQPQDTRTNQFITSYQLVSLKMI